MSTIKLYYITLPIITHFEIKRSIKTYEMSKIIFSYVSFDNSSKKAW